MPFLLGFPDDATQVDIFKRWPELTEPLIMLAQRLLRDGPLSNVVAELIFTYVSGLNRCEYAYNIHRYTVEELGVEKDVVEALLVDVDSASIEDALKPLLKYMAKLTQTPSLVSREDADSVFEAGWSEDEFQYAISICSFTNYLNRSLNGHGILGNPEHWQKSGKFLAEHEYMEFMPK